MAGCGQFLVVGRLDGGGSGDELIKPVLEEIMASVQSALATLFATIELTTKQRTDASGQQARVREALRDGLTLSQDFLSGSYARDTAVRPLNDIDLFIVLAEKEHGELRKKGPVKTLALVKKVLDEAWPDKEHPIIQSRSVRIDFAGTGISYDVVPAFSDGDDVYRIPDRGSDAWISTNPRKHKEKSTAANKTAGSKLKPAFKALKHWRNGNDRLGRSFHLEVVSWSAFGSDPGNHITTLHGLFVHLRDRVLNSCPDPAGLGPDVDLGLSLDEKNRLRAALSDASSDLARAKQFADDGKTHSAHFVLRELFGSSYPEQGKDPSKAAVAPAVVIGAGSGVDRGGSRFG